MGGDFAQRRQFVADAAAGMAVDAVLEILKAAAETSQQAISHSLVRLLSKLAAHAESGSEEIRPQAEAALREQVQRLLQGWTLADPNPGVYGAALQRMSRAAPTGPAAPGESPAEPERVVAMALEVEMVGPRAVAAVERIVEAGRLGALLEALQQVPDERGAARAVWERVATSDVVRRLVRADPPDFTVLDRLIPHVGYAAAEPLLDALAVAQSRGARRGLLAQLVRLGAGIGPLVVRRLEDDRWYVIRNLLALLEDLAVLPEGFSPARFALHADALVRLTTAGRTLFGKERLPPKSPELLVALAALVTGWAHDPRTRAVLARAAQSTDREIRAAAARPVPPLSPTDRR